MNTAVMSQFEASMRDILKGLSDGLPAELCEFVKQRALFKGELQIHGSVTISSFSDIVTLFLSETIQEKSSGGKELLDKLEGKEPATGQRSGDGQGTSGAIQDGLALNDPIENQKSREEKRIGRDEVPSSGNEEIYHISEDVKLGLDDSNFAVELISWFVQYIAVVQNSKAYGFDGHLNFYTEGVNNRLDFHRDFSDSSNELNATIMSSSQACETVIISNHAESAGKERDLSSGMADTLTQTETPPTQPMAEISTQTEALQTQPLLQSNQNRATMTEAAVDTSENTSKESGSESTSPEDIQSLLENAILSLCKKHIPYSENLVVDGNIDVIADSKNAVSLKLGRSNTALKEEPTWEEPPAEVQSPSRPIRKARQHHKFLSKSGSKSETSTNKSNKNSTTQLQKDASTKKSKEKSSAEVQKDATNNVAADRQTRASKAKKRLSTYDNDDDWRPGEAEKGTTTKSPPSKRARRNEPSPSPVASATKQTNNNKIKTKSTVGNLTPGPKRRSTRSGAGESPTTNSETKMGSTDISEIDEGGNQHTPSRKKPNNTKSGAEIDDNSKSSDGPASSKSKHREGDKSGEFEGFVTRSGKKRKGRQNANQVKKGSSGVKDSNEKLKDGIEEFKDGSEVKDGTEEVKDGSEVKGGTVEVKDGTEVKDASELKNASATKVRGRPKVKDGSEAKDVSEGKNESKVDNDSVAKIGSKIKGKSKNGSKKDILTCKICNETCKEGDQTAHFFTHKKRDELPTDEDAVLLDGIPTGKVLCDICFKLISKNHIVRHIKTHQENTPENLASEDTKKSGLDKSALRDHAEKSFDKIVPIDLKYCEGCKRMVKGCWNRHLVMYHDADTSVLGLPREKLLMKCLTCEMMFPDNSLLRHHQKQKGHLYKPTEILGATPRNDKNKEQLISKQEPGAVVDADADGAKSSVKVEGKESKEVVDSDLIDDGLIKKIPEPPDLAEKIKALLKQEPNPTFADYTRRVAMWRKGLVKEPGRENRWLQRCLTCEKTFKCARDARIHISDSHLKIKRFECQVCGLLMANRGKVNRHLLIHTGEKPYVCPSCGKSFRHKITLSKHMEDKHQGPPAYTEAYMEKQREKCMCEVCGMVLIKASLKTHMSNMHTNVGTMVECHICGTKLRENSLKSHIQQIHERRITHTCDMCGKGFRHKKSYDMHMNSHRGIRPYKCEQCGAQVQTSSALKIHMNRHMGVKPHRCSVCDRAFTSSSERNTHQKSHEEQRPYKCPHCPKTFKRSSGLSCHVAVHNPKRELKFECKLCGKKFYQAAVLTSHEKRHAGIKPFACSFCGKAFVMKADCKRHENCTHKGMRNSYKKKRGVANEATELMVMSTVEADVTSEMGEVAETVEIIVDNEQAVGEVLYLMSMQGTTNVVTLTQ